MLLVLNLLLNLFRRSEQSQEPSEPYFQAFILEPILTPSAFLDNPFDSDEHQRAQALRPYGKMIELGGFLGVEN